MPAPRKICIFGGGTISHVRSHLALCAPAFGDTAFEIYNLCLEHIPDMHSDLILTRMAAANSDESRDIVTNDDVARELDKAIDDPRTKIIFFSCAMCDWTGSIDRIGPGKYAERLKTTNFGENVLKDMILSPAPKIINRVRQGHREFLNGPEKPGRKDIFLVGFKATCGATEDEQYIAALGLLKGASCNLVFANDVKTRLCMVVTPEEARYHVTDDRDEALSGLVEMTKLRSQLTFTRSTVVAGEPVPWNSDLVPIALRQVVNYCIEQGAYKPFNGATVGHFAAKIGPTTFLTSMRKTNFNDLQKNGLVRIETDGPDTVIAYGAKPSVGGQSQRIVFKDHPDCDCIAHFHCPSRHGSQVPTISQREYECGSHECGENTSKGLQKFGNLYAVYLDQHGPNIVFNKDIDPQEVINFIEANFDLSDKTGGPVSLEKQESH